MKLTPQAKQALKDILGSSCVLDDEVSLSLYSYDCSLSRTRPEAILLVQHAQQVAPVLRILSHYKIPFVPRASATNHAGSCVALKGGVILNLTALNHILQINTQEEFAVVEPGVLTADLQDALAPLGYFYAPDPASARACTIGGNAAQNASGARCLKYGGTLDHVLAADFVLPDGEEITLSRLSGGPDLVGLLIGSEGTLGVFTKLKVKILPLAKHIKTFLVTFPSLQQSVQAVSALVAQGIIPRCMEAMDKTTLQTIESFSHAGYPQAESLLILELDASPVQIKKDEILLEKICKQHQAQQFLSTKTEKDRRHLWQGRQSAYAAMARLAPNVLVGDATVPRSELPAALEKVQQLIQEKKLRASLLFHAGDGNFHPHILFDQRNRMQTLQATRAMKEILKICVAHQGTLSGEHGIGVEKRALMACQYEADTLRAMTLVKQALDPDNLANPLKIFPDHFAEKAIPARGLSPAIQKLQGQLLLWRQTKTSFVVAGTNSLFKTRSKQILSSKTLHKILEIDTANYTVTAQAGVPLKELALALKKAQLHSVLPSGKGTLGGLFSSGVLPEFYEHVLGIEALLPDGSYIRYGGKFMKNAAGYPLVRLFAGAQGSLGLVTQLTFKVFAHPVKQPKKRPFQLIEKNKIWARLMKAFAQESQGE